MGLDLWVPMSMQAAVTPGDRLTSRGNGWLQVLLRLAPGGTVRQAQAGFSVVMARLAKEYPDGISPDYGVAVYPLWRDPGSASAILAPVLTVLMAVVVVVLLIACANLANLLLARGAGRRREVAVRLALGASRARIVVQLLAESAALALAGGAAGLAVSAWTSRLLTAFVPPTPLPIAPDTRLSPAVFLFGMALALATTVLFGLVPALQTSRPDLVPSLKETLGAIGGRRRAWVRRALVVTQVSLSLVLLVGAGLFIRTVQNTSGSTPGSTCRRAARVDGLPARRLRPCPRDRAVQGPARPGARGAGRRGREPRAGRAAQPVRGSDMSPTIEGYEPAKGEEVTVYYDRVAPRYLQTLGIRLVKGRAFTDADASEDAPVIVISETMARRYWKGRDPIGGRVNLGRWATVIGVAADVKYAGPSAPPVAYMYLPVYAFYRPDTTLIVRTAGSPTAVAGGIRAAMADIDPNLPLFDVTTMAEHRDLATFIPRLAASLLGGFGLIALLLASVGLYGLLAFAVSQRTPEIGVRLALGAQRGDVLRLVVGEGLRLTAAGVALGLAAAFAVMPLLASQLVGVSARDGASYAVTSLVLVAAAAVACYLPARRAASVDPLKALRYE